MEACKKGYVSEDTNIYGCTLIESENSKYCLIRPRCELINKTHHGADEGFAIHHIMIEKKKSAFLLTIL